ncbi:YbjN domain-containing protein [Paracoccus sp. CPCC 101403]|uniref:YbjN domain-containing protein n=1 Tax=Paracoccus broussonetiae TaxID=3075834 RepID=A0ABU3EF21_9RHOB|nr:YbjN domain-containing protein [Paracoccus sp. CPCC 101403]MDT1062839.1 YbjN domain-containing protein [Paracoccus sp. CPCC 101403]
MRASRAFFLLALLNPAALMAEAVTGDPEIIGRIMAEQGMKVVPSRDVEGMPMLESEIDETLFNVYFYDCAPSCRRMQFVTSFKLTHPMTAEDANDWNRDNPVGKLFVADSGDPFLEMDIGLADDGLGRKNFEDALATWRAVLGDFRASITD